VNFSFSDEQEAFREVLRRFLESRSPTTEVRRLMETDEGWDEQTWAQLSDELGLPAIAIPEQYGGQGFGFVELCIVLEEMGRKLLCAPYFSSAVLAANAILNAGSEADKKALLPAIAAGSTRATLAFTEPNGQWNADGITVTATPVGDGYQLDGVKTLVLDGCTASLIVVAARLPGTTGEDGIGFFTVDATNDGCQRRALQAIDPTRKLAALTFSACPAKPLGAVGEGAAALRSTLTQAAVGLASESVGGAQALFDSAVEYARMRMQFGRAIGSFQAIKHKCADMLLEVELAKSAAYYAAEAVAEADADLPAIASLAKAAASDAYMNIARDTIQIHGGIGFTWENDTHLWFKRAKASQVFLGDSTYHRELLMRSWAPGATEGNTHE
jgi:alkylation response protein AidB-like acyl-CoA dehydrogenase